jgi:hypothetical protein
MPAAQLSISKAISLFSVGALVTLGPLVGIDHFAGRPLAETVELNSCLKSQFDERGLLVTANQANRSGIVLSGITMSGQALTVSVRSDRTINFAQDMGAFSTANVRFRSLAADIADKCIMKSQASITPR